MTFAILDAAEQALTENSVPFASMRDIARAVLAVVTPMIEDIVLERAAKVAEEYDGRGIDEDYAALTCEEIAAAIRALKEQP